MLWSWLSFSKQIVIRSFKWGTVHPCWSRGQRLQKYQRSKLEVEKNLPDQPGPGHISLESGWVGNFLLTSNFDLWYFCSLLTYKDVQYLIWKIRFITVRRQKPKAMTWLSTCVMFAQSTPISYQREAFVKTEVSCTVFLGEAHDYRYLGSDFIGWTTGKVFRC